MKKRGSMAFLMELIVVILFFSLSTAVTLRLFVAAHEKERESTRLSDAVERAQGYRRAVPRQGDRPVRFLRWVDL